MEKTGSFDLNFPGARLVCDTPQKRASLLNYINGDANTYEVELSHTNFEQDYENAIYNTTYIHEGKHFHDHLLCPYLLHNYTLKLHSYYYSLLAIHAWQNGDKPYKYIPLPFCDWLDLSYKEQIRLIEKKGISPSDVPIFSTHKARLLAIDKYKCDNKFIRNLLFGAANYWEYQINSRNYSFDGLTKGLNAYNFCESLALNQQLYEIVSKYGSYGYELYASLIFDNLIVYDQFGRLKDLDEERNPNDQIEFSSYMGPLFQIEEMFGYCKAGHYNFNFLSNILFWALCGPMNNDELPAIEPINRINRLLIFENKKHLLNLDKEADVEEFYRKPIKIFKRWDRYINSTNPQRVKKYPTFLKALHLGQPFPKTFNDFYNSHIKMYQRLTQNLGSIGIIGPSLYLYEQSLALSRMSKVFCEMPFSYLNPDVYSNHLGLFVNVPFRFEFNNVMPIRKEECKNSPRFKDNWIEFVGDNIYGNNLFFSTGHADIIDWLAYDSYSSYINFADALFGHSKINMPGALIKQFLPGIKPWFFKNSNC